MKIVFAYFALNASEKQIAKVAGTTLKNGTSPEKMIAAAKYFGFDAFYRESCNLNDLYEFVVFWE